MIAEWIKYVPNWDKEYLSMEPQITKRQRELLAEFNNLEDNKSNPLIKSFFDKAKKFWKK